MGTLYLTGSRGENKEGKEFVLVQDTCAEKETYPILYDGDDVENIIQLPQIELLRFTHLLTEDY